MSKHNFTRALLGDNDWDLCPFQPRRGLTHIGLQLEAAFPGKKVVARGNGTSFTLDFEDNLTPSEITTLTDTINADIADNQNKVLKQNKRKKCKAIDKRTVELIRLGFTYADKQFSLSNNSQRYWNGLGNLLSTGLINYPADFPLVVNTIDDEDEYGMVDIADATAMYATAAATLKAHLGGGTALKKQVRQATTQAELDLVVDNR